MKNQNNPMFQWSIKVGAIAVFSIMSCLLNACSVVDFAPPASPTISPILVPTFVLPPTQVFPTPLITPTKAPTPQLPTGMEIDEHPNIHYKSNEKLDVYSPLLKKDWPIVVILHGGGVDKKSVRSLGIALAEQGVVVFTPEYQSYEPPPDQILTGVTDAACAVRYARANGSEYGGNPHQIIVVGHSAGGAFGAVISLAGDQYHGDCLINEGSAVPDIFIGLDGAYDILRYTPEERLRMASPDEWKLMSPYTYIGTASDKSKVSFHLFVGKEMELLRDAQAFKDALIENGYTVFLMQFPGVDHMYIASGNHANTVWAILSIIKK